MLVSGFEFMFMVRFWDLGVDVFWFGFGIMVRKKS